jgi:cytochrome c-type biogenesis protein CcmE
VTELATTPDVTGAASTPPPVTSPGRRRRRRRSLVVLAVLAAAFCFLLVEGIGNSLDYYDTVDQALAHRASLGTSTFRLEGVVLPHSVRRTDQGADFLVGEGRQAIAVRNSGSPPQLFRVGLPVIVVGHFARNGGLVFESDQIMVKHSANYTPVPSRDRMPSARSSRA